MDILASDAFSHNSMSSTFRWPSILVGFCCAVFFVTSFFETYDVSRLGQSVLVVAVLIINVTVIGWDTNKYHQELHDKARYLASRISDLLNVSSDMEAWTSGKFFPQLYLPHSPCITLQWTFRDGKTVNLPTPLLVKGDVIKLCPGTPAPGLCQNLEPVGPPDHAKSPSSLILKTGELFVPMVDVVPPDFTGARFRQMVSPVKFVMMETPFLNGLKLSLEGSWTRPRSLYDKERHGIIREYIEQIIIPLAAFLLMIVCFTRYSHFRDKDSKVTWTELNRTLHRMSLVIFPLVPFALPISWIVLNAMGVSHILYLCPSRDDPKSSAGTCSSSDGPTGRLSKLISGKDGVDPFDDIDTEVGSDVNDNLLVTGSDTMTWKETFQSVIGLLKNKEGTLWRSANVVQALGSMTALCCVDKKGILSWPNPTADKVFFLTSPLSPCKLMLKYNKKKLSGASDMMSPSSQDESVSGDASTTDIKASPSTRELKRRRKRAERRSRYQSRPEVLDVTHDPHSAFSMQFDDPNWDRFLPNVKPLGLAILLNTCNQATQGDYTRFCDHIACESFHNEAAVPVVNKRCLCELSRQIGFTDSAVKDYEYLFQLAMFRHVKHEVIQHGKLLNSLNIPRLKMPFPHVASALIKEKTTNTYQLFSQGTGDLILDACSEFWDGNDLRILTQSDRKRILDFYNRSSLTAYCMAFSYVPLTSVCPDQKVLQGYTLELAPDSSHVFPHSTLDSAEAARLRWNDILEGRESSQSRLSGHYLSNESLSMKDKEARTASCLNSPTHVEGNDAGSIASQMNNEVFIGMVTMQYQACPDFVQLVEQLEKACIRFVHFSKENELRSRVFSEKMGLESGWNCHISLLSSSPTPSIKDAATATGSQQNSSNQFYGSKVSLTEVSNNPLGGHSTAASILRSQSAPCTVNLDPTVVKFADETATAICIVSPEKCRVVSPDELSSSSDGSSTSSSSSDSETDPLRKEERKRKDVGSPSPSRVTDSTGTETGPGATDTGGSTAIPFDVLNRAKLPKGIENIRPHLEEVDNVPLLVSLFTDCTPETTCEMISIMQDYGEVVCVLGSAANMFNIPIFLEANASISIEPLYPEVCVTQPVIEGDEDISSRLSSSFLSPTALAKQLISLPCSLVLQRDDPIGLQRLIAESRTFMSNIRNSLQFLLCCSLSLSLVQLLGSLLFLPPLLTSGQVVWLVFFILPTMSFPLMVSPPDPHVMTTATGKNLNLTRDSVIYFLFCYLIKFTPSMLLIILFFLWTLTCFCTDTDPDQGWDFFLDFQ